MDNQEGEITPQGIKLTDTIYLFAESGVPNDIGGWIWADLVMDAYNEDKVSEIIHTAFEEKKISIDVFLSLKRIWEI